MKCTLSVRSISNIKSIKPTLLPRTKDPLLASSSAQHYTLENGSIFIVRSPSSTLPTTMSYPPIQSTSFTSSTSSTSSSSSLNQSTSTSTSASNVFNSNSSPFLFSTSSQHLLPSTRPTSISRSPLTSTELDSLHALRISAPSYWTRSKLAVKFGISQKVVGRLGWGEGKEAEAAEKSRKILVDSEKERREGSWGWKKTVAREERRRRRSMW